MVQRLCVVGSQDSVYRCNREAGYVVIARRSPDFRRSHDLRQPFVLPGDKTS